MKSFGVKPWMMPQPASDFVGIVTAKNDPQKMNLIPYEPVSHYTLL